LMRRDQTWMQVWTLTVSETFRNFKLFVSRFLNNQKHREVPSTSSTLSRSAWTLAWTALENPSRR
jgi:hypothetical protein